MFEIEDYIKYLKDNDLSENESDMLCALAETGEHGLTASEISKLLGLSSHIVVNRIFGGLGHKISDFINKKPEARDNGTYRWWRVLADDRKDDRGFVWFLHENLISALKGVEGVIDNSQWAEASEFSGKELREGSVKTISVNAYERNPIARKKCIQHWGLTCQICGFDFEAVYGEVGEGYIHVHHLIPLSEIKSSYEVDPINDMLPLCANCHSIIHRQSPPLSVSEMHKYIQRHRKSQLI